jgi:hypothetical protein
MYTQDMNHINMVNQDMNHRNTVNQDMNHRNIDNQEHNMLGVEDNRFLKKVHFQAPSKSLSKKQFWPIFS